MGNAEDRRCSLHALLAARSRRAMACRRCPAHVLRRVARFHEVVASSRTLADFTDLAFRAVLAPYRGEAPEPDEAAAGAFQPALDRVTREERRARKRGRMPAKRTRAPSP